MCGIFGVANPNNMGDTNKLRDFFLEALHVGTLRGTDAVGMYQVHFPRNRASKEATIYYDKAAVNGIAALERTQMAGIAHDAGKCFATVGHHRAATHGAKDKDVNAHPFIHTRSDGSQVIGVHNGTLTTWDRKVTHEGVEYVFDVDSDWLMFQLSIKPAEEVLGNLTGAAAIVWYDSREARTINMWTNGQRPLHFALLEQPNDRLIFASEPGMLHWLASRNNLSLKGGNIYECKSRMLYRFDGSKYGEFEKYTRTNIPFTYKVPAVNNNFRTQRWDNNSNTWVYTEGAYNEHDWYDAYPRGFSRHSTPEPGRNQLKSIIATARNRSSGNSGNVSSANPGAASNAKSPADQIADAIDAAELNMIGGAQPASTSTRPPGSSMKEQRTLQDLGIKMGTEAVFEFEEFIEDTSTSGRGTIRGTVLVSSGGSDKAELFDGEIRHARADMAKTMRQLDGIVRLIGCFVEARSDDGGVDPVLVCTHPTGFIKAGHSAASVH